MYMKVTHKTPLSQRADIIDTTVLMALTGNDGHDGFMIDHDKDGTKAVRRFTVAHHDILHKHIDPKLLLRLL